MKTNKLAGLALAGFFWVGCTATPDIAPPLDEFEGTLSPTETVKAELRSAAEEVEQRPVFRKFGRFKIGAEVIESETDQKAVMTGDVVVVGTSGMIEIARAERIEFNKESRQLVLTGSPQVIQGTSLTTSKSPEVVVTLRDDMSYQFKGRTTKRGAIPPKSE